jgi:hypothetical protein
VLVLPYLVPVTLPGFYTGRNSYVLFVFLDEREPPSLRLVLYSTLAHTLAPLNSVARPNLSYPFS